MNGMTSPVRIALLSAFVAVLFGVASDPALAGYSARIEAETLKLKGNAASDKLVLRLQPGSPGTLQADVGADGTAEFSFDRTTFTAIDVEAGAGDDEIRVDQSGGTFVDELLTMNGGAGNDTLIGGAGAEIFLGGTGEDFADGNIGADQASLGGGDDRFQWDPGDGSDAVEGQGGQDALDFNGSGAAESIDISANGERVRFARNVASIAMDLDGVERLTFHAFGGADVVVVNDLAGTGVKMVDVDLNAPGGGGGDGQPDSVTAIGTDGNDRVTLVSPGGYATVLGLSAQVLVESAEASNDNLNVATLDGRDTIVAGREVHGPASINVDGGPGDDIARYLGTEIDDVISIVSAGTEVSTDAPLAARFDTTSIENLVVLGLVGEDTITGVGNLAPLTSLTIDGGEGGDTLRGGNGADLLIGGKGSDVVDGNQGTDRALMGADADVFQWDPGDGSDTVEGQGGDDQLDFNASNASEEIALSANGDRLQLTRNIGAITMDADGIERINIRTLGGTDTVTVNSLAHTGVKSVDADLNAVGGGGDNQPDNVIARGTDGADKVSFSSPDGRPVVNGFGVQTRITGGEAAFDSLIAQTLGGPDTAAMTVGVTSPIPLRVDGGDGGDVARYNGTAGADQISLFRNGTEVAVDNSASGLFQTAAVESLVVSGQDGEDLIAAINGIGALTTLTLEGGDDNDDLRGADGADILNGGKGNDSVDGNIGADQASLGGGDDRFQWDPGDGSDTVEGQGGDDQLDFNASNASEEIALSANGDRLQLTRNIGAITMDADGIERINIRTLGGTDTVTVNSLAHTGVKSVDADLNAIGGAGDGVPDTVVLNGTAGRDVVDVTRSGEQVSVAGLAPDVRIVGSEGANDTLRIQTLEGNDEVTIEPAVELLITPVVNLGPGE